MGGRSLGRRKMREISGHKMTLLRIWLQLCAHQSVAVELYGGEGVERCHSPRLKAGNIDAFDLTAQTGKAGMLAMRISLPLFLFSVSPVSLGG